jgi:hypothetical protein
MTGFDPGGNRLEACRSAAVADEPFRPGRATAGFRTGRFRAYFLHVNRHHHTVALIETGRQDLHHLMVELHSLDDVGPGYDIALGLRERTATTLGRHPNDCVTSYYLRTPPGFMLEHGWGQTGRGPETAGCRSDGGTKPVRARPHLTALGAAGAGA